MPYFRYDFQINQRNKLITKPFYIQATSLRHAQRLINRTLKYCYKSTDYIKLTQIQDEDEFIIGALINQNVEGEICHPEKVIRSVKRESLMPFGTKPRLFRERVLELYDLLNSRPYDPQKILPSIDAWAKELVFGTNKTTESLEEEKCI